MFQSRPPRAARPTRGERKNGWTDETLAQYLAEQDHYTQQMIDPPEEELHRRRLSSWPIETAGSQNPFKW